MGKKGEEAKLEQEGYGSGKERNRMGAKHGGCHKKKKGNLERMIVSWRKRGENWGKRRKGSGRENVRNRVEWEVGAGSKQGGYQWEEFDDW